MDLEIAHFIKERHTCNWKFIGKTWVKPDESQEMDFFRPANVSLNHGESGDFTVIFADKPSKINARFKNPDGEYVSDGVEFPIVMQVGDTVEIFDDYRSVDVKLLPAEVRR